MATAYMNNPAQVPEKAPADAYDSTSATLQVDTGHGDVVHDAQLDYYGKRLATASSDRLIKIFDVDHEKYSLSDTLPGHEGPIHALAWAHPSFGTILASCSFDGKVFVWREDEQLAGIQNSNACKWVRMKEHMLHTASVNDVAWAPHQLGPVLACASSDGKVSVLTFKNDGQCEPSLLQAHVLGVTSVAWDPSPAAKRLVSGGCDGLVRVWTLQDSTGQWGPDPVQPVLEGHSDWVRDVAFAPAIGVGRSYLASAGQDRVVYIWTQETPTSPWTRTQLNETFSDTPWRLSWSVSGNILAVSCGDGQVTLWKEDLQGVFEKVSNINN